MTPERYQQVKAAYEAATDCEATRRLEVLDEACGNDAELRRAVESLLADRNEAETFLETPAYRLANGREEVRLQAGQRIGVYKLLQELGHGGMGAVWLAQRADDQYQKRVAIKLIKRGMDTEEILQRFRYERQILASLEHPNIGRLLDGGTTPDGLPYFVMEHIEGQPIDEYCNARRLATSERLQLFRTVCAAVQFAHQNLVVHRDLKPGNILVTADGTVKLLDFGIAKILKPDFFPETIVPTAAYSRLMTPAYASPEQVRGQTITTASDVYSLGVILYQLLTGHRPYELKNGSPQEIERVICHAEPTRPSVAIDRPLTTQNEQGDITAAITPETLSKTHDSDLGKLRKTLRGDLDNIVLMALKKEPNRRYASVEQFSEDLRRHLEGLPVIARKDTLGYRVGKFITRNKPAVAATTVIALLLLGFLITTLVQSARIKRERDRATLEQSKAEKVSSFLVDLFKVSDPSESRGNTVTAREILDKGADKVVNELQDQPEVQANLMNTIGGVYERLGLFDRSEQLLNQALQRGRQVLGNEHAEVARTLDALASINYEKGDYTMAVAREREALAIRRKLYGNVHKEVGDSLHNLGIYLLYLGQREEAGKCWDESLAINRKLFGNDSLEVAEDLVSYSSYLSEKNDNDGAEAALRDSVRILRQHRAPENLDLMTALNNLAIVLVRKKNYPDAAPIHRELLNTKRRIYGAEHPDIALTLNNLGNVLRLKGDLAEADSILREALAMRRKLLGANHPNTVLAAYNLGKLLVAKNSLTEAETLLRTALETTQKIEHKDEDVAYYKHGLGECLLAQKRFPEAEIFLTESFQVYQSKRGVKYRRTADVLDTLISLYEQWEKPQKVEEYKQWKAKD